MTVSDEPACLAACLPRCLPASPDCTSTGKLWCNMAIWAMLADLPEPRGHAHCLPPSLPPSFVTTHKTHAAQRITLRQTPTYRPCPYPHPIHHSCSAQLDAHHITSHHITNRNACVRACVVRHSFPALGSPHNPRAHAPQTRWSKSSLR